MIVFAAFVVGVLVGVCMVIIPAVQNAREIQDELRQRSRAGTPAVPPAPPSNVWKTVVLPEPNMEQVIQKQ